MVTADGLACIGARPSAATMLPCHWCHISPASWLSFDVCFLHAVFMNLQRVVGQDMGHAQLYLSLQQYGCADTEWYPCRGYPMLTVSIYLPLCVEKHRKHEHGMSAGNHCWGYCPGTKSCSLCDVFEHKALKLNLQLPDLQMSCNSDLIWR